MKKQKKIVTMKIESLQYIRNIQRAIDTKNQALNKCIKNLATVAQKVTKLFPQIKDPTESTRNILTRTNEDMKQSLNKLEAAILNGMGLSPIQKEELEALQHSSFLFSDLMFQECQTQLNRFSLFNKEIERHETSHIIKAQLQSNSNPVQE